ncbi:MAG: methylated-DNA--[protein]-cysteine S-methyltransferase [Cellulomonadaceae bacterium]|nr:methylated-DNA--[protein]-cysteine S-methyltransferase [Cellulomonadaceae bacterium]
MVITAAAVGGDLTVVVTPTAVLAAGYGEPGALLARLARLTGLDPLRATAADLPSHVAAALRAYGDGDAGALDAVPVVQPGGEFHQAAWEAMRRIPPGTTITYSALAAWAGRPAAVRAAGAACARNLVAPFVPCHRVLRTDGTLGGYAYGLDVKRALLAHERGPQS